MTDALPLHPEAAAPRPQGPGQEIRARRDRIREQAGSEPWRSGREALVVEAARATLQLTGTALTEEEIQAARQGAPTPAFGPALGALGLIGRAVAQRDPTQELISEVHAVSAGLAGASPFRTVQIEPQFQGASLSPPQTVALRLGNLLEWVSGASGRDLETAPRAALFFARFLEISPFERANFRVAHLMLTFFALADDQPPIWFEVEDAPGIREDVSRAFRFDTAPLTERIEGSLHRSLDRVAGPPGTPATIRNIG